MQTAKHILAHLHSLENKANQAGMKRFAIGNDNTLGISLPVLREISKNLKKQSNRHALAKTLWKSNIHEAMILASMLADPKQFSAEEMDSWTLQFYSWDLCDQVCTNLFHKTPYYLEKAFAYSYHSEEFVKRCGFVLMVQYTVHHKKESDEMCLQFLKRIEEEAGDERNFVKKALNWCLRQIGKRNAFLHPHALAAAHRILLQGSRSARWIANDAIRELESEAIIQRLGLKP
jgi:3-methyladenine DNA glycosylase AlkD